MAGRHGVGDSLENDLAATVAALGAEIHDPVGLGDHVEVVLDHHRRVAGIYQPVEHADQLLDVCHVQADGRLIQYI